MATGLVDKWNGADLADFGAIYPFVGSEVFWFVLCVAVWLGFHVWQALDETKMYKESEVSLKEPGHLRWALRQDTLHGAVATDADGPIASMGEGSRGSRATEGPKAASPGTDAPSPS